MPSRAAVAATVNVGLTMLYWRIGGRVGQEILKGSRAEYGEEIVSTVSRQLEMEYGNGFSAKNIRNSSLDAVESPKRPSNAFILRFSKDAAQC